MNRWRVLTALCAFGIPALVMAQVPSVDGVRALITSGEYLKAVAEADRVLKTEGDRLTDAQVYIVEMLKAESFLQLKRIPQAIATYGSAMQVATDQRSLMAARATQTLLGRVQGTNYIPKTGANRDPIDVLDAASRKRAMEAMAADMSPQVLRDTDNALAATTLTQAEDAFLPLLDLYSLQVESGFPGDSTLKLVKDLADHVHHLLTLELDRVSRQVRVADRTSSMYDAFSRSGRRGLSSSERDDLSNLATYIDQIQGRLLAYRRIAQRLTNNSERWDTLYTQYSSIRADLELVLKYANS